MIARIASNTRLACFWLAAADAGLARIVEGAEESADDFLLPVTETESGPVVIANEMPFLNDNYGVFCGLVLRHNCERPHSARDYLPAARESLPELVETIRLGDVMCATRYGGLRRSHSRQSAGVLLVLRFDSAMAATIRPEHSR